LSKAPFVDRLRGASARAPATRAALAAAISTERPEIDPIIDELVADRVLLAA
jgi:hypothetical protein